MDLPTPIELLHANGVIGFFLRHLPRTVLCEAETHDDQWTWLAEWVGKNPGRNLRIGGVKVFWPGSFQKTFEAAASQAHALRRLGAIAAGARSMSQDWHKKLGESLRVCDEGVAGHCAKKIATPILHWEPHWFDSAPPEVRQTVRQIQMESYAADLRRIGRSKADKKWKDSAKLETEIELPRATKEQKVGTELTLRWLSIGDDGFPGYCFIHDKVLATMLGLTLPFPGLLPSCKRDDEDNERGRKFIEDCRLKIGLKKAEVLIAELKPSNKNEWAVLDKTGTEVGQFRRAPSFPPK